MGGEKLQVENGNFTRIINKSLDDLIGAQLSGAEFAVCLVIIRKTWGFHKKEDQISISQFVKETHFSRQTVITALKRLQLVNLALLVKKGKSKKASNIWRFNKYVQLGKQTVLVKSTLPVTSQVDRTYKRKNTKERITRTSSSGLPSKSALSKMYKEDSRSFSDEYEPVIDAESGVAVKSKPTSGVGKQYQEILVWAAQQRGSGFVNIAKQYAAMKKMRLAGITPVAIKERWLEMADKPFWQENGYDFTNVLSTFDKK